jgi:hypothetical protein
MIGLFVWILLSVGIAFWARSYNRSGLIWGALSVVISPIISAVFLFVSGPAAPDQKTCPKCTEKSPRSAKVCRICGYDFESGVVPHGPN